MEKDSNSFQLVVISTFVLLYVIPLVSVLSLGEVNVLTNIVRLAALFGFVSLFISILLTNYLREVRGVFGRPFLKVHHWFAILGILFITIHPVTFAIYEASLLVFIPDFSSWYAFWSLAGRPALYIAYAATLSAILRNRIKKYWRYLHGLMYIVLTFAFVHGLLIGANFANTLIAIFFLGLLIISYLVAIQKRFR